MMYRRRYRLPSIWREMNQLQDEMNRLFDTYQPSRFRTASGYPAVNIWSREDSIKVTAEVPGINPKDIEISVVGETLTLSGIRKPDELKEGARYHRHERGYGKFTRAIQLPYSIDANKVDAKFKNGVLDINLPRAEADKPKKITVKRV